MSVQSNKGADAASGTIEHYRMPDAGEGLTEAEIVTWRVAVGDVVEVNDIVVEVETAKSLVELPCPFAGTVTELLAATGETVAVGTPILAVRTGGDVSPGAPAGPTAESAAHPSTQAAAVAGRTAVLVGYGPAAGATRRRSRLAAAPAEADVAAADESGEATESAADGVATESAEAADGAVVKVLAKPPVRKLAKDLGVDLASVPANADGVVDRAAVLWVSQQGKGTADWTISFDEQGRGTSTGRAAAVGEERRIPVKGVRKHTAEAMVTSAFTAPHVTEWVQVDVTASIELLERLKADRRLREVRLSPFTLVARAMCLAVRHHPEVNVSWDGEANEIVVHPQVNFGFAAATERGLVVPVVSGADSLGLAEIAVQIADLVDTARAGKLQSSQMSGVTLTATNVGVFGVDGGTPILPPGTGLILVCGQVRRMPWVIGTGDTEQVVPRDVMTLAVSFDHRMIDGELGSRYLAEVAHLLSDPAYALALA